MQNCIQCEKKSRLHNQNPIQLYSFFFHLFLNHMSAHRIDSLGFCVIFIKTETNILNIYMFYFLFVLSQKYYS